MILLARRSASANTWKGRPSLGRKLRDTGTDHSGRSTLLSTITQSMAASTRLYGEEDPKNSIREPFFLIMTIAHSYFFILKYKIKLTIKR